MKQNFFTINDIPSIVWGEDSQRVIIVIHGNRSNKADIPIEIIANVATKHGLQVLSFDLPQHGDRRGCITPRKIVPCIAELNKIMEYAKTRWTEISLFGCSLGAYLGMIAYNDEDLKSAYFLSPIIDFAQIMLNTMKWTGVDEKRLEEEKQIVTPFGETLYWKCFNYAKQHTIDKWDIPTYILYGSKDNYVEIDLIINFIEKFNCALEVVPNAEHYFCDSSELKIFEKWFESKI